MTAKLAVRSRSERNAKGAPLGAPYLVPAGGAAALAAWLGWGRL
jgi:hypothetical protein